MSFLAQTDNVGMPNEEVVENTSHLDEQLQLMKLCFYDHEFGIGLNSHGNVSDEAEGLGEDFDIDSGYILDFDPLVFVESKISHGVPLENLCKDLTFFEDLIRDKISHHVNTGMRSAFLSVSGYLVGMQEDLQCAQLPLEASIKRLNGATEQLLVSIRSVQEKLERASTAEEERNFDIIFLRAILSYEKVVDIMESLMQEITEVCGADSGALGQADRLPGAAEEPAVGGQTPRRANREVLGAPRPGFDPHFIQRLEGVTISMHQLYMLAELLPALPSKQAERAEVCEYAKESQSFVLAALGAVMKFLSRRFIESPRPRETQHLQAIMRLYDVIGAQEVFCDMFAENILYPHLENVLSWKAEAQARQSTDETVRLLQRLEEELRDAIIPFLPLMRRGFVGVPLFPVSKILWPTVCKLLTGKFVTLCDIGIPESFQKRYTAVYRLLSLVEHACTSAEELVALRRSPDVALWNQKWNTDIYAVMRITEVDKTINVALMDLKETTEVKGTIQNIFQVLLNQIQWLFSEGVLLSTCIPRFVRKVDASCKLVFREVQKHLAPPSVVSSSTEAGTVQEQPRTTDDNSLFFVYITGVSRVIDFLENPLLEQLKSHCRGSPSCILSLTNLLCVIRNSTCKVHIEDAQTQMIERVVGECIAGLQSIKTVRSAYSHTKKPPPTAPSWYIASIVDPILRFAATARENGLPESVAKDMLQAIVERVVRQFTTIARDTLITARKTEESWEKLRRRRDGNGTTAGNLASSPRDSFPLSSPSSTKQPLPGAPETMTDREKMLLQLNLDAKSLENKLTSLGTVCSVVSFLNSMEDLMNPTESDLDVVSPK